jgi:protein TonB
LPVALPRREIRLSHRYQALRAKTLFEAHSLKRHFNIMKLKLAILLGAGVLGGCGTPSGDPQSAAKPSAGTARASASVEKGETTPDATSTAFTLEGYKRDLAQRISQTNSNKVYDGRPQALLRSVIVVKYVVDSRGNLMRSEILRSNRDRDTEAIALASLKSTAPFPKPLPHLLRNGRVEISETWLFNNDGRFQLRTVAQPQMDE